MVLCNDYDVSLGHNGSNQLSKYVKIYYFIVKKIAKETKFEVCTHTFDDLNQNNLLYDFYKTVIEKIQETMSKYLAPLKLKDYLTLICLIVIGFGWLLIDQIFLPEVFQRFVAFFILIFILYYLQFLINKPSHVIHYANSIVLITVSFIVIVSLVLHVIINHDFSYKSILIWIISAALPYVSGVLYMRTKK